MLIRKQDKKGIIDFEKCVTVFCENNDLTKKSEIFARFDNAGFKSVILGEYSTIEKAIAVLDSIQNNWSGEMRITPAGLEFSTKADVFEMPPDNEENVA